MKALAINTKIKNKKQKNKNKNGLQKDLKKKKGRL
jgi:hypothetical protein